MGSLTDGERISRRTVAPDRASARTGRGRNNIANLNTTGFKADSTVFHEYLMPVARAGNFAASDPPAFVRARPRDLDRSQPGPGRANRQSARRRDQRQRVPHRADTARRALHRNGALQINSQGQLVTSEGLQVVGQSGPIVFQPTDHDISIGNDGTISVREGLNTIDAQRGKLKLASFEQPQRLQKDGTWTLHGAGRRDAADGTADGARQSRCD